MNLYDEVNLNGLNGPTHFFGGLSFGNVASMTHQNMTSSPKQAALQCLEKIEKENQLGHKQLILPPQPRPDCSVPIEEINHNELTTVFSSSYMWAANAGVIHGSKDTLDKKVHITPANLAANQHRQRETKYTEKLLKAIFSDSSKFVHHSPVNSLFPDEGAANIMRFGRPDDVGVSVFVYGENNSQIFPARQSKEAFLRISEQHQLIHEPLFIQQNPKAINKGVFHNDVIATSFLNRLICHEKSFVNQENILNKLRKTVRNATQEDLFVMEISEDELSLEESISTYFFNSQIILLNNGDSWMVSPIQCRQNPKTANIIQRLCEQKIVSGVYFIDLNQSMKNGGGPACLRLRILLNTDEWDAVNPGFKITTKRISELRKLVKSRYPDNLDLKTLSEPSFSKEVNITTKKIYELFNLDLREFQFL